MTPTVDRAGWLEYLRASQRTPFAHFRSTEFDCHDGTRYPPQYYPRLVRLITLLEAVRTLAGSLPVTVLSGYRTPAWNKRVGGALLSQHLDGTAADIAIHGVDPAALYATLKQTFALGGHLPGLGGLGFYPGWVHVDVRGQRPGRLDTWEGTAGGPRQEAA